LQGFVTAFLREVRRTGIFREIPGTMVATSSLVEFMTVGYGFEQ
jgi:hypothetical protein